MLRRTPRGISRERAEAGQEQEPFRWPFPLFATRLVLIGLVLSIVFLYLMPGGSDEEVSTVRRGVTFSLELGLEIAKALIITGAIAWFLEVSHVIHYVEERLFRVFMNSEFLRKLDPETTLSDVHRAITTFLVGGTDDPEAKSFYDYLRGNHMRLAGETFRRNLDMSVEIEPEGEPPNVKMTVVLKYIVVPVSSRDGNVVNYRVPSPMVLDRTPGLPDEAHVREWVSTFIYPNRPSVSNAEYSVSPVDEVGVARIEVSKDFSIDLTEEVTYHERTVMVGRQNYPWAIVLRIGPRTKEVTLSVRWPGATNFHVRAFGELTGRHAIDQTSIGVTYHYDDWMVRGHGVVVSFLPPANYV